jgi:hypothetical protein
MTSSCGDNVNCFLAEILSILSGILNVGMVRVMAFDYCSFSLLHDGTPIDKID